MANRLFGLIGFPLTHSFSKKYFTEKFKKEGIDDSQYDLYEIESAEELLRIIEKTPNLEGLNVTIPHKQAVLALLDDINDSAKRIGAVNVITIKQGKLTGFNSDYFGFRESLSTWLEHKNVKALILGTGGASKAVRVALEDLEIESKFVSRNSGSHCITYQDLNQSPHWLKEYHLIVNTTPLGTSPNIDTCPEIPYHQLSSQHYLYDLVYNPEETKFMTLGKDQGAQVKNGYEMLVLQAEKSWEIWNA